MPLLDHFHPPLHGPRRWEGFHHAWAASIARQLNEDTLPPDYYAEPEISIGPELEVDVATLEKPHANGRGKGVATATWTPPRPKMAVAIEFTRMDNYEVRVFRDIGDVDLRAAIELVSPANKDRPGSRQTFAAKCAGYIQHGISVVIIDVVTSRSANLHAELFEMLEVKGSHSAWKSSTGLYAVAYRAVTTRKRPRVEVWPEPLALGEPLPTMPLWLTLDLCVPVHFEESYIATCRSLRIPA
jgi:uncharacterized protein DUF4058